MSDQPLWITRLSTEQAQALVGGPGPLSGLRFAVKDNIDVEGVPTTAADPRRRTPAAASATAVRLLLEAGAEPVGKTNMDQYATGLVGTRSPYGACHSVRSPAHVSGGSSSGSAVAVASGEVDLALGTDTAGSGRVPAAFNGIVGLKPSKGLVSTSGVLPACASLDCVSVFARTVDVARRALAVLGVPDPADPWSREVAQRPTPPRPRVGVPAGDLGLDPLHAQAWAATLDRVRSHPDLVGVVEVVEVDVSAFLEAAALLYGGPWVAERRVAFGAALDDDPAVDPTVRAIVAGGPPQSAEDAFAGLHRLAELDLATRPTWAAVDALLLPTTPTHPTLEAVAADPVGANSELGRFTNMTNLLDLCAVAFPGPDRPDGLPFGVQLLAPAGGDRMLLDLASSWLGEPVPPAPDGRLALAVAGAHLTGQPLNADLVARGAVLQRTTHLAPGYRMYLVDGPVARPGVTRVPAVLEPAPGGDPDSDPDSDPVGDPGPGLEVEVWSLPEAALAGFIATVAPPLGLGRVELADGTAVLGFIATADAVDPARDLTPYGGWRAWLARS